MNVIDLSEKTREELMQMVSELEPYMGRLAPNIGEAKLRDAVEVGLLKRQKVLEQRATDEANRDRMRRLGIEDSHKHHPSPETVAIETSRKVYCTFVNMENPGQDGAPGADVRFWKGDKYEFHLFDQQRHVLPLCLVVSNPEAEGPLMERMTTYWEALGYDRNHAVDQAEHALRQMAIPVGCVAPRVETRIDPQTQMPRTFPVGRTPRFMFTEISDAPADAEFGLVVDEVNSEDTQEGV